MSECANRHCYSRSDRNTPTLIVVEDKMYVSEFFFCVNRTDVRIEARPCRQTWFINASYLV